MTVLIITVTTIEKVGDTSRTDIEIDTTTSMIMKISTTTEGNTDPIEMGIIKML